MVEAQGQSCIGVWGLGDCSYKYGQYRARSITSGESVVSVRIPWKLRARAVMTKWAERAQRD